MILVKPPPESELTGPRHVTAGRRLQTRLGLGQPTHEEGTGFELLPGLDLDAPCYKGAGVAVLGLSPAQSLTCSAPLTSAFSASPRISVPHSRTRVASPC